MFVTPDKQHLIMPYRQDLANIIPGARPFDYEGRAMLLVPNGHDEARVARNVGLSVPAPILTRYDWRGLKPWDVQKTTAALLSESPRAYVLNSFGTGKTRSAIWAADYLQRYAAGGKVLIAAPLSTLNPVWEQELFRVLPQARVRVLHNTVKAKRIAALNEEADWYVINHHGLALLQDELIARGFTTIILDELAIFRNRSTKLWKAANAIIRAPSTRYAWGMTGSPTPSAPTDAWAQIRLITPARTTRSMVKFRDDTMVQLSQFRWVPRPEANEIVKEAMSPAVRYTLEDVQELPPTVYTNRDIKLDPEVARAYRTLVNQMVLLTNKGESITALNAGILTNKLIQVSAGYIYTDTSKVYALPNTNRLDALLEVLEETDRKAIVFVPYVHAAKGIAEFLKKKGKSVELIYGATAKGARDRIFNAFQNEKSPRILVAHPGTMSHGLTLTAANVIVWYAPVASLETYEQANARIARPGQTSKTSIVHLVGTPVERATYARLKDRAQMQDVLLELFHQQKLDF